MTPQTVRPCAFADVDISYSHLPENGCSHSPRLKRSSVGTAFPSDFRIEHLSVTGRVPVAGSILVSKFAAILPPASDADPTTNFP